MALWGKSAHQLFNGQDMVSGQKSLTQQSGNKIAKPGGFTNTRATKILPFEVFRSLKVNIQAGANMDNLRKFDS